MCLVFGSCPQQRSGNICTCHRNHNIAVAVHGSSERSTQTCFFQIRFAKSTNACRELLPGFVHHENGHRLCAAPGLRLLHFLANTFGVHFRVILMQSNLVNNSFIKYKQSLLKTIPLRFLKKHMRRISFHSPQTITHAKQTGIPDVLIQSAALLRGWQQCKSPTQLGSSMNDWIHNTQWFPTHQPLASLFFHIVPSLKQP